MTYRITLRDGRAFSIPCDDLLNLGQLYTLASILWPGSKIDKATRIK